MHLVGVAIREQDVIVVRAANRIAGRVVREESFAVGGAALMNGSRPVWAPVSTSVPMRYMASIDGVLNVLTLMPKSSAYQRFAGRGSSRPHPPR